jgi:hypothetical protein
MEITWLEKVNVLKNDFWQDVQQAPRRMYYYASKEEMPFYSQ